MKRKPGTVISHTEVKVGDTLYIKDSWRKSGFTHRVMTVEQRVAAKDHRRTYAACTTIRLKRAPAGQGRWKGWGSSFVVLGSYTHIELLSRKEDS